MFGGLAFSLFSFFYILCFSKIVSVTYLNEEEIHRQSRKWATNHNVCIILMGIVIKKNRNEICQRQVKYDLVAQVPSYGNFQ